MISLNMMSAVVHEYLQSHSRLWENPNVILKLSEMYWIRKLTIKHSSLLLLHTFRRLTPSHLHTHPTPLSDAFSHPFTHNLPPPSCPSLLSLPVDTPNKATCVVSGCLGERSPCKPAGHVYQGTVSTPALRAALFSFPTPSHFHPLDLSSLPSILLCSSDPPTHFSQLLLCILGISLLFYLSLSTPLWLPDLPLPMSMPACMATSTTHPPSLTLYLTGCTHFIFSKQDLPLFMKLFLEVNLTGIRQST